MRRHGAAPSDENGNELIEFLALFPVVIMVAMIIFQLILAFQTISVAASAAREAARAAAVCGGDGYTAARNASVGYDGNRQVSISQGDMTVATVSLRVPTIKIIYLDTLMPWISSRAAVRTECGR